MASSRSATESSSGSATVGYEAQLWQMADALRGSMDAAEYKHVVLGLIFLKYISDAFEEQHARLEAERAQGADPEDPDEYRARNIFWVPPEARWHHLKAQAKQPSIGKIVDDAMEGIERDNPALKGVLPKDYARPGAGQDAPRAAHRHDQQHQGGRRGGALQGRAGPRVRVLPVAVRQRRRQEGRRVLHAPLRRQAAGRDARTLPRPCVRPVLRLLGHVRAIRRVPARPRQRQRQRRQRPGGHLHLRAGIELHHLAPGQDEPRHPRHRRADRARRHLPQRPAPRPEGRLHPRQSALQHLRLGRRPPAGRQALAVRRAAGAQRQLRLGAAHRAPPRARRRGRLRARQRLHEFQPVGRGRDPQEPRRGRPGRLHGGAARPAVLLHARSPRACGSWRATGRTASSATAAARCCSSTRASSAAWSTARTAS